MDTEKTDIKAKQKLLEITDAKIPYFFVLDKDGKILNVQNGNFSEAKLDKLEDALE
jgi:predicted transcriptional regulator